MRSLSRLSLTLATSAAATALLAACGGGGVSPVAGNSNLPQGAAAASRAPLFAGTTFGAPAFLTLPSHARGWMSADAKPGKGILYVSSYNKGTVTLYKQKGSNQSPIGMITAGLAGPEGMAVDGKLNLYVTNTSNNTVTMYQAGQTSPAATYSQDLSEPAGVCIGNDNTVYVTNLNNSVTEYAPGSMTPERTIVINFPIDCALDKENNLYVTFASGVEKYAPGATAGTNLGIHVNSAGGIQIDKADDVLVADQSLPGIYLVPAGQSQPSLTFGQGGDPNPIRFDKKVKKLYVGEPLSNTVNVYSLPSGNNVNSITNGVNFPAGVALSPESNV